MSDFETHDCVNCGTEFAAHPSGNAAENRLCSPHCQTAYEG